MLSLLVLVLIFCHFSTSAFPNPFKKIKEKLNDVKNEIKNEFMTALKNNANNEIFTGDIDVPTIFDELNLHDSVAEEVVGIIQHEIAREDTEQQYNIDDVTTIDEDITGSTINVIQTGTYSDTKKADTSDSIDNDRTNNEILTHIYNDDSIPVIIDANTIDLDSIINHFTVNDTTEELDSTYELEITQKTIEEELLMNEAIESFRQSAEEESLHLEEVDVSVHETLTREIGEIERQGLRQKVEVEAVDEIEDYDDEVVDEEVEEVEEDDEAVDEVEEANEVEDYDDEAVDEEVEEVEEDDEAVDEVEEAEVEDDDDEAVDEIEEANEREQLIQEAEEERLRQEAEEERLRQEAEEERLRQEAEEERLKQEADAERLRQEAEEERLRQEAEEERLRQEVEEERLRQEAEEERIRHEAYYGNWSSFSLLSYIDPEVSNNIIKSLKFSSYFDKSIGEFKVGILGDDMTSILPNDLIINVEKAMNRKFVNVSSVDITSLLSHSLASIQYIATILIPLHIHPQLDILHEKPAIMSQIESTFASLCNNTFLSNEIRISRNIIENKLNKMETHIMKQQERTKYHVAHDAYKLQRKIELLREQNEYLIELIAKSSRNISNVIAANHKERVDLLVVSNKNVLNESEQVFKIQLEMEKAMLQHKVDVAIELLKYQAMQEQQYVIENELNNNILLEIMNNNTRDSTQKVIETIFNDVTNMLHQSVIANPVGTVWNNIHVVAIVLGVIVAVEIVGFIPIYLQHRKNSNILLKSNQMRKEKNQFQLSELVLTSSMMSDLKTYMDNVQVGLRYNCSVLPNMLIIGSSGTGKSVLAYAIAAQLQAAYISICEADLEPLGMNAGFYLRKLFQSKYGTTKFWNQNKKPFLIIIDGADLLVKPRAPKLMSKSTSNVSPRGTPHAVDTMKENVDDRVCSNCLYTLLNEMKSVSPHLSLMITTNRSVGEIDSAILNRTDSLIVLEKPSQLQRLRFILYYLPMQIGPFLDDETRKILLDESLVQFLRSMNTSNTNVSKITNRLFQSIINCMKKLNNDDPETDRPASLNLKIVTTPIATPEALNNHSNIKFDLENCVSHFVVMTEGWSFRELEKFLLSLRQEILSVSYVDHNSKKLLLTSMVFMKTLSLVGNNSK